MSAPRKRNRRFTDTMKWDNKEFRKLPPEEKLLFMWLCDNCDMAGCLEWDTDKVEFETKLTSCEDVLNGLLAHCDSIESNGDLLWMHNHIEVQGNVNMSPKNNVYKPLYEAIKRNSCKFQGLADMLKELTSPLQAPSKGLTRGNSNSSSDSKSNIIEEGESEGKKPKARELGNVTKDLAWDIIAQHGHTGMNREGWLALKRMYPKADHEPVVRERIVALENKGISSSFYASLKYHLSKSETDKIEARGKKAVTVEHSQAEWDKARDTIKTRLKVAYRREVKEGMMDEVARAIAKLNADYSEFPGLVDGGIKLAVEQGWPDGKGL